MTEPPRLIVMIDCRDAYREMIAMFRARIVELGTNYESIEAATGLPDGYVAKMLSQPSRAISKKGIIGAVTLGPLMQVVGIKFGVFVDENAIMHRLDKRESRGPKLDAGVDAGVVKQRKGRIARTKQLILSSSKQRSMTARIAACERWQKHRAKQAKLARRRELRRKLMDAAARASDTIKRKKN